LNKSHNTISSNTKEAVTKEVVASANVLTAVRPALRDGLIKLLAKYAPGIGPAKAQKLVDEEGTATAIATLRKHIPRSAQHDVPLEDLAELYGLGLTDSVIKSAALTLGPDRILAVVRTDPYKLCKLPRVGFLTADKIARNAGLRKDSPERIRAGIFYALETALNEGLRAIGGHDTGGHTHLPYNTLTKEASKLLGLDAGSEDLVAEQVRKLLEDGELVAEIDPERPEEWYIYLPRLSSLESRVAKLLAKLAAAPRDKLPEVAAVLSGNGAEQLTAKQRAAIKMALACPLSVLTGGPGTGKTTAIRALCRAFRHIDASFALCAPTGKAAKRLAEATGEDAKTIHRLLEWKGYEKPKYNERNRLEIDYLVVDEASMIDLYIANTLFSAINPARTKVLLVGDPDQLPPVGPGNFLRDIINTKQVPVVELDLVFRQAARSLLRQASWRVRQGLPPYMSKTELAKGEAGIDPEDVVEDFYFIERRKNEEILELVLDLATTRIPRYMKCDPLLDVQIVVPQRTTKIGGTEINLQVQKRLNPNGERLPINGFRVGDKLLNKRNNYELGLMNGETVIIKAKIVDDQGRPAVLLETVDGEIVEAPLPSLKTFALGYAVTCHSMQGSESRAVIVPISTAYFSMLSRPLLYTAITRAKDLCVLVGQKRATIMAIRNQGDYTRHSRLGIKFAAELAALQESV